MRVDFKNIYIELKIFRAFEIHTIVHTRRKPEQEEASAQLQDAR